MIFAQWSCRPAMTASATIPTTSTRQISVPLRAKLSDDHFFTGPGAIEVTPASIIRIRQKLLPAHHLALKLSADNGYSRRKPIGCKVSRYDPEALPGTSLEVS